MYFEKKLIPNKNNLRNLRNVELGQKITLSEFIVYVKN